MSWKIETEWIGESEHITVVQRMVWSTHIYIASILKQKRCGKIMQPSILKHIKGSLSWQQLKQFIKSHHKHRKTEPDTQNWRKEDKSGIQMPKQIDRQTVLTYCETLCTMVVFLIHSRKKNNKARFILM